MANDDKRYYRNLKKQIKETGKKKARLHYKKQLENNPEDAPFDEYDYGHDESSSMNGRDGKNRKPRDKK